MSIVNLGLYGVGIMRTEYPTCEGLLRNASSMKAIRQVAKTHPEIEEEVKGPGSKVRWLQLKHC